jgi:hypothetical protein
MLCLASSACTPPLIKVASFTSCRRWRTSSTTHHLHLRQPRPTHRSTRHPSPQLHHRHTYNQAGNLTATHHLRLRRRRATRQQNPRRRHHQIHGLGRRLQQRPAAPERLRRQFHVRPAGTPVEQIKGTSRPATGRRPDHRHKNRSAIATLVECSTRFTKLVHLPDDHTAPTATAALARAMHRVPEHPRRTLTWDPGSEMAEHYGVSMATGMTIYFCDPASPWQRRATRTPTAFCANTSRKKRPLDPQGGPRTGPASGRNSPEWPGTTDPADPHPTRYPPSPALPASDADPTRLRRPSGPPRAPAEQRTHPLSCLRGGPATYSLMRDPSVRCADLQQQREKQQDD